MAAFRTTNSSMVYMEISVVCITKSVKVPSLFGVWCLLIKLKKRAKEKLFFRKTAKNIIYYLWTELSVRERKLYSLLTFTQIIQSLCLHFGYQWRRVYKLQYRKFRVRRKSESAMKISIFLLRAIFAFNIKWVSTILKKNNYVLKYLFRKFWTSSIN